MESIAATFKSQISHVLIMDESRIPKYVSTYYT